MLILFCVCGHDYISNPTPVHTPESFAIKFLSFFHYAYYTLLDVEYNSLLLSSYIFLKKTHQNFKSFNAKRILENLFPFYQPLDKKFVAP